MPFPVPPFMAIAIAGHRQVYDPSGDAPPADSYLLLETGDFILLETGDKVILE